MAMIECLKQGYEKKSGFLGSKKVYLDGVKVQADQVELTFEDVVEAIGFDDFTGVQLIENKNKLVFHLQKKQKREFFFDNIELMEQIFELVDDTYRIYAIELIEKFGINNVVFEFGTIDVKLENGVMTNGISKIPLDNIECLNELIGVGGNFYELKGTDAKGKNKSIIIYPKRVRNFSLFIYLLENFTEAQLNHEVPEGFFKDVTVDGINKMTNDEIKELKLDFGDYRTLEGGMFKFQGKSEMLLDQMKGYEITKSSFDITGEKEKESGRMKSVSIFFSLKKSKHLDVLEAIAKRFAPTIEFEEREVACVFEQLDVETVSKMTIDEVMQLKISFDRYNRLDKGIFTSFGKPRFSLEEITGYSVREKMNNSTYSISGVSSRVKGRDRHEWFNLDPQKAENMDVLEVIIDRFTDAVLVKHYQETSAETAYYLTVDTKAFKLYESNDAPWIDFNELEGMASRGDGILLTLYFKSGSKYDLHEKNTVNFSRNYWDLYNKWNTYLQEKIDDVGVESVSIRFGSKIILEKGVFRASDQKGIKYSDAVDMRVEKKYFNIQCDGYGMMSYEPMNLDLLRYIIFELGEAVEGYDRYFKSERLKDEKMMAFEKKHGLSVSQERDLAFSSILTVTNYQSPRTFKFKKDVLNLIGKVAFKASWKIGDRESAHDALDYLSDALGHTPDAQRIYETILSGNENEEEIHIDDEIGYEQLFEDLYFANTYLTAKKHLIQLGYVEDELAAITNFAAWDYGRTGYIARYVVQLGYLIEEEAWPYVKDAATRARLDYSSWREFIAAYILGRALGYGDASGNIFKVLEFLLEDEQSPFNRLEFFDEGDAEMMISEKLRRFKDEKNERILRSMIEYMNLENDDEVDFDCGYTQHEIDDCGEILDDYINSLIELNGNIGKIMDCVKKVVQDLNELNKKASYSLIETDQREALVAFIHDVAIVTGLPEQSDDITYEWREW